MHILYTSVDTTILWNKGHWFVLCLVFLVSVGVGSGLFIWVCSPMGEMTFPRDSTLSSSSDLGNKMPSTSDWEVLEDRNMT